MKILHINTNYISTRLHKIFKDRLSNYVSNTVYSPNSENQLRVIFEKEDDVVDSACVKKLYKLIFKYKENRIFNDLVQKINIYDYDVMHAHTLFTDGYVAYKVKKRYGLKYIVTVRNTDVNAFFKYRKYLKNTGIKILSEASAVIFLSEAYRDRVISKYVPRKLRGKILEISYVIPNGIDEFWHNHIFSDRQILDKDTLNIICVGAVNKNKNIISVIKVIQKLNAEGMNCHLDIAGRPEDKKIVKIIENCEFAKYYGCLNKEQLIEIYRQNDIFVLPSFCETFGLVYAEAMSQGLPVVYTRGQGFDKQFEDGKVGFSIDCHSIEEIKDAILKILDSYETIYDNCINLVDKFKWDKIVERYVEIYNGIDKQISL